MLLLELNAGTDKTIHLLRHMVAGNDRFRYRCRYVTDSGVIGGKDFVQEVFDQVKHLLGSKNERKFTPVGMAGLRGFIP